MVEQKSQKTRKISPQMFYHIQYCAIAIEYHLSDTEAMTEVVEWIALVVISNTCLHVNKSTQCIDIKYS